MVVGGAKNDGNGRNIVDTYATKSEVGLSGAAGWFKVGNTIIQWGQEEMTGAVQTFDFRTKFPTAVGAIIITPMGDDWDINDQPKYRASWWDINQFTVKTNSTSRWRFSWIAIGR